MISDNTDLQADLVPETIIDPRPNTTVALLAFFIALAAIVGMPLFTRVAPKLFGVQWFFSVPLAMWVTFAYQLVFFMLPGAFYYLRRPVKRPAMRLFGFDWLSGLLIVLSALVGMVALNQLAVLWALLIDSMGLTISTGNEIIPSTMEHLWLYLLAMALAPALFEEFLFRGLLLPSLERLGEKRAVLASGLMFAMLHGRIEALPAHLLLGCVLALLVLRTGSLFASILFHGVYNGALLIVGFLQAQADPASLSELPTLAQSLGNLPLTCALLLIWGLLTYSAMQRGVKTQKHPLPPATPAPLTKPAKWLLGIGLALLFVVEAAALIDMLPAA